MKSLLLLYIECTALGDNVNIVVWYELPYLKVTAFCYCKDSEKSCNLTVSILITTGVVI